MSVGGVWMRSLAWPGWTGKHEASITEEVAM